MKKIVVVCGGLLLFLLAIYFAGRGLVNSKIDDLIEKANEDDRRLSLASRSLSFRFTHLGLQLDSVAIDQAVGSRRITGTIDQVNFTGLSIWKVINDQLSVSDLLVEHPNLEIRQMNADTNGTDDSSGMPVSIQQLRVNNGRVSFYDADDNFVAKSIGLSSTASLYFPFAPAAAPDGQISIDSLIFPGNNESGLTMSGTRLDTRTNTLSIGTVRLTPRQTVRKFLTSLEFKDDWTAMRADSIRIIDFPADSLWGKRRVIFPEITIGDLNLAVYENPNLERNPVEQYKPFPVEQFRNLPFPALLQKLRVNRAHLSYGVCAENTEQPDITFDGTINLTNFSTWKQEEPAVVDLDFRFEETSPLTVRFDFDQTGDGRGFTATGELRDYDLTKINPLMVIAANADIESGKINSLTHNFSNANDVSSGELTFRYEGLEVKLTGRKAFFGNLLEDIAIRDSNPRNDGDLIIGKVTNEHDPTRSFFNHYWKSLVSGMTSSVAGKFFVPDEKEGKRIEDSN